MNKLKVMKAHFPMKGDHPDVSRWAAEMELVCANDKRIESLGSYYIADTPITMSRNRAVQTAIQNGIDILIMTDDDMGADIINPKVTFWESSLNFMLERWDEAPTVIAVPYCSAPPLEEVMVFRWGAMQTNDPNPNYQLKKYEREESIDLVGIQPVAALATGLVAIDMRIFTGFTLKDGRIIKLTPPYFYYEWTDNTQTVKSSTEDVVWSRNTELIFAQHGLETCFVNWDCWAIHHKSKAVGKPHRPSSKNIAGLFVKGD